MEELVTKIRDELDLLSEGRFQIQAEINVDRAPLEGDREQLISVLRNLGQNAYQALAGNPERGIPETDQGRVVFRLKTVDIGIGDTGEGHRANAGAYYEVQVADNGPGISEENLSRIFEETFTTRKGGTGLGLSYVRANIENHGGQIRVTSQPGQGTCFTFLLPIRRDANTGMPARRRQMAASSEAVDVQRKEGRILVVDDQPAILRMIRTYLEKNNFQVEPHVSAREALDCFLNSPGDFNLVLTDCEMPEMDGIEMARKIKEHQNDIPIILTTGYARQNFPIEDRQVLDDILEKPFDFSQLVLKIKTLVKS